MKHHCLLTSLLAALCCAVLLPFVAVAEEEPAAASLPIDFSGGMPLREACFDGFSSYDDPTIHVEIETGDMDLVSYWIATVTIAHPSQLRTAAAESFDTNTCWPGDMLADRVNAVLALDGDFYAYSGRGYILRQGQLFLNKLYGKRDVLLIDEDGDFHIVYKANDGQVGQTVDGKKVINAFFFGPALVENGKVTSNWNWPDMAPNEKAARMALCQTGPLSYKVICCTGPRRGHMGMPMAEFAQFVKEQGAITAYNLDGGNSTFFYFHGKRLNDPENNEARDLMDIIYFASAWDGGEEQK